MLRAGVDDIDLARYLVGQALLGASPGASTAASILLDVVERCFPERWRTPGWRARARRLVPSLGRSLEADADLCRAVRARSAVRARAGRVTARRTRPLSTP